MGFRYRIQQFWQGISAGALSGDQKTIIRQQLTPSQWQLFQKFSSNDQQHSFRVWRRLKESGVQDIALLRAALLHDIGKTRLKVNLIERSWIVLGRKLWPTMSSRWGNRPLHQARWWEKPFVVREQHPLWGAEMVQSVESDPRLCTFIKRHQDQLPNPESRSEDEKLLARLQWADDLS
ncbi:MAG: HDIG domain-containing protein [Ardenticatenaceae bacterium]|nr:HDIG domain-containing protein [Ardenticatenaceae bacterium]